MPIKRISKDGLHFFTILAFNQREGARSRGRSEGAYVNCWVNFRLYDGALVLAKFYIRKYGWRVRAVEGHRWINGPADLPRGSVRYFREALKDGASFVFNRYPSQRSRHRSRLKRLP